jgi:hypothetical protein
MDPKIEEEKHQNVPVLQPEVLRSDEIANREKKSYSMNQPESKGILEQDVKNVSISSF